MPPREVFLSHSREDHEVAAKLSRVLTEHRIPVFFSPENIGGAQQWQNEILSALERCDWFVVLLSPAAIESMWVKREVAFALNEPRYEDRIVPLNYVACELGGLRWLTLMQMVDLSGEFADGCRELLEIWGIGLRAELLEE